MYARTRCKVLQTARARALHAHICKRTSACLQACQRVCRSACEFASAHVRLRARHVRVRVSAQLAREIARTRVRAPRAAMCACMRAPICACVRALMCAYVYVRCAHVRTCALDGMQAEQTTSSGMQLAKLTASFVLILGHSKLDPKELNELPQASTLINRLLAEKLLAHGDKAVCRRESGPAAVGPTRSRQRCRARREWHGGRAQ
eukprot:6200884-Pleurochrysis_carterae.AAC.7